MIWEVAFFILLGINLFILFVFWWIGGGTERQIDCLVESMGNMEESIAYKNGFEQGQELGFAEAKAMNPKPPVSPKKKLKDLQKKGTEFLLPNDLGWECNDMISMLLEEYAIQYAAFGTEGKTLFMKVATANFMDKIYAVIKSYQND